MKKLFKKLALAVVALLTFSVGSNYTVKEVRAADTIATITFDDTSKRTVFTTTQQVWVENGITVTNNKSGSTSNVADYCKPARFYKSSELIVEAPGVISEIVFDANSSTYATALKNSIGATASASSDKVTVSSVNSNSYTISSLTGQIRLDAITVTYSPDAEVPTLDENIKQSLNSIKSYMSLSYSYKETVEERTGEGTYTDVITSTSTGVTVGSYTEWTNIKDESNAVYSGCSATNSQFSNSLQLKSKDSESGIVTTLSGGYAKKIIIDWEENTTSGRVLDIFGKNVAYDNASDLYENSTKGTKIGSITYGTSTELDIDGDYPYIGIRSNSGAVYINSITIVWELSGTQIIKTMSDSKFYVRCGVDTSLTEIEGVDSYGIRVSTGVNNVVDFDTSVDSWGVDTEYDYCYVVLNLKDIINDKDKLMTEFTVCAYVVVDGVTYTSEETKVHSVVSMVEEYYTTGNDKVKAAVEHLYNYFVEKGYIAA